jgi:hypothetical protein
MKKRIALTVDEDIYDGLKFVPRGFSVSEFVSFMLRGMLKELQGKFPSQADFESWVNSDPEYKKMREGIREAWGPSIGRIDNAVESVKNAVKGRRGRR